MMTTEKAAKNIQVYWDESGPGWFANVTYDDISEKTVSLMDEQREDWDLDDAIREACWQLDLDLQPHDFARENLYGLWQRP